jgi:hypothetical protein
MRTAGLDLLFARHQGGSPLDHSRRVSRFSLDALVNISTALGCRVRVDLEAA